MLQKFDKISAKARRHKRVRAKISGTTQIPRLCVYKSNMHIYAQIVDDTSRSTLISSDDLKMTPQDIKQASEDLTKTLKLDKPSKRQIISFGVGLHLAQQAQKAKVVKVVFDRSGYKYHGLVRLVAEGARAGGLDF